MENIIKNLKGILKTTTDEKTRAELNKVIDSWNLTESILAGDYLDTSNSSINISGENIKLTGQEFQTIKTLIEAKCPMGRDELLHAAWTTQFVGARTVDVHIRKLRSKIGNHIITTRRGVGYSVNHRISIK